MVLLSATKACEGSDVPTYGPGRLGFTLESCKHGCEYLGDYRAIDLYRDSCKCNFFRRACNGPASALGDPVSFEFAPIGASKCNAVGCTNPSYAGYTAIKKLKRGIMIELDSYPRLLPEHKQLRKLASTLVQIYAP